MTGRVLVAGAIAQHAIGGGGNAWAFLQYVLGFQRLGLDTYYVEHIAADRCRDARWQPTTFDASANVHFFREVMQRFGLGDRSSLFLDDRSAHVGLAPARLESIAAEADLFLNMSGRFHDSAILGRARRRAYLDMDPGFVQVWQEQYGIDMNLGGHDIHFTVGLNLGNEDYPLPTCNLRWHPTLPPVLLSEWHTERPAGTRYTTVADWRGYGAVEWQGKWYGQKSEEFLKLLSLPRQVSAPLELCLAIHPDEPDRAALLEHGWLLRDPGELVSGVDAYRDYLWGSRGELTAVKNGYVAGRTGWLSDRTVCYLAAGRPAIVQDTHVPTSIPSGHGLVLFSNQEEAAAAVARVESDYELHARAARDLAHAYFDSDLVLRRLLERASA